MPRFRSRLAAVAPLPPVAPGREEADLRFADVRLNLTRREAWRGGRSLHLTVLEYELLAFLLRHPYEALTRRQLAAEVWANSSDSRSNYVDVAVMGLRRKLEAGGQPRLVQTLRGYGYALRDDD